MGEAEDPDNCEVINRNCCKRSFRLLLLSMLMLLLMVPGGEIVRLGWPVPATDLLSNRLLLLLILLVPELLCSALFAPLLTFLIIEGGSIVTNCFFS